MTKDEIRIVNQLLYRMTSLTTFVENLQIYLKSTSNASELSPGMQLVVEATSDSLLLTTEIVASLLFGIRSWLSKNDVEALDNLKAYLLTARENSPANDIFGPEVGIEGFEFPRS